MLLVQFLDDNKNQKTKLLNLNVVLNVNIFFQILTIKDLHNSPKTDYKASYSQMDALFDKTQANNHTNDSQFFVFLKS